MDDPKPAPGSANPCDGYEEGYVWGAETSRLALGLLVWLTETPVVEAAGALYIPHVPRELRRWLKEPGSLFGRCPSRTPVSNLRTHPFRAQVLWFSVLSREVVNGGVWFGVPRRTVSEPGLMV
jgi:hypothetical protein